CARPAAVTPARPPAEVSGLPEAGGGQGRAVGEDQLLLGVGEEEGQRQVDELQQLLEQAGVLRVQRYGDEAEGATLETAGVELDIAAEGEPVGGDGHRVGAPVADHRE